MEEKTDVVGGKGKEGNVIVFFIERPDSRQAVYIQRLPPGGGDAVCKGR